MSTAGKELIIEELIRNILETKYEAFTQENLEDAKYRLIDIAGCAMGGAYASGNSVLIDLVRGWGGKEEATILVHGDRVPVHYAAMVNSIMCRSYDYEVCSLTPAEPLLSKVLGRMTGHISSTVDSTAITVADQKRANGKELLAATILGADLAARIGMAEDFNMKTSFEVSGTTNAFGVVAVAGRLWALNERQMLNAFGILVNLIAGSFQCIWDGVHAFKLPTGTSAMNALFSAELARNGFTGIKDPLYSPQGYYNQYCKGYHSEFSTMDLGKIFIAKGMHKMHPSCYSNHPVLECGLQIVSQHDFDAGDIAEVTVGVIDRMYDLFLNQPFEEGDSTEKALFNWRYGISNVLLRKSTRLEHYTGEFVKDPKIIELTGKVKIVPLQSKEDVPVEMGEPAEVTVKMKDGREFSGRVSAPRGVMSNPATREEIKDKYWANVDFCKVVPRAKAEEALAMLENLEMVDDVSQIVKLLTVKG